MTETALGTCAITATLGKRTETFTISFVPDIDKMTITGLTAVIPTKFFDLKRTTEWLSMLFANTSLEAAKSWLVGDNLTHLGARPGGLSYRRRKQLDLCVKALLSSFTAKKGELAWSVQWSGFDNYTSEQYRSHQYGIIVLTQYGNQTIYFADNELSVSEIATKEKLNQETINRLNSLFSHKSISARTTALTNGRYVIALNLSIIGKEKIDYPRFFSIIAHEALHVVMGVCSTIGYNPVNEDEPAAYMLDFICREATLYFCPELRKTNLEMK